MNVEWLWSSSILILLVILIRFLFRKRIRPCVRYALWLVVAIRLLLPFSLAETAVSVLNLLPGYDEIEAVHNDVQTVGKSMIHLQEEAEGKINTDSVLAKENVAFGKTPITDFFATGDMGKSEGNAVLANAVKTESPRQLKQRQPGQLQFYQWLLRLWVLGAGLCGLFLLAANVNYGRRLKRSRMRIADKLLPRRSAVPVYISRLVQTPCLFGLLRPAVYVTEEVWEEQKLFDFVLCHENTHYIHKDHGWAFLRMLCFCLHWYNPLVWIAVYLSKQDGELACDEGVVERLEEKQRVDYGNALLELSRMKDPGISGWQISTTMRGSKLRLKERLWMIVYTPKKAKGIQMILYLLVICLLAVTFTGRNAGGTSFAAEQAETEDAVKQEESVPASTKGIGSLAESDHSKEIPFEESVSITLGEKEYQLLCEGYTTEDGLYHVAYIRLADAQNADSYVDVISTAEVSEFYWQGSETDSYPVCSPEKDGNILITDLNFDGWNDLCFQGWDTGDENIPYYCMLWNPQIQRFEYSVMLYNVEADAQNQWLSCKNGEAEHYSVTYYRYDAEDKLHMLRYVEKDLTEDAVLEQFDLTYVEDDGMYTLPAVVAKDQMTLTMIEMAKQSLNELYQWTGDKIDTACFQVNNLGGVSFALSAEDMEHSRIFFTRYYGTDTGYNLSGYDKAISSINVVSGRSVWFSPMLFRVQPENMDAMSDEEVVIWYFERVPLAGGRKVKSIEQRYVDLWTIQTEAGSWFEVVYDAGLREVEEVIGPYPDDPAH